MFSSCADSIAYSAASNNARRFNLGTKISLRYSANNDILAADFELKGAFRDYMEVKTLMALRSLGAFMPLGPLMIMALMALWSTCAIAGETLENDALRIRFEDAKHGFNVAAIENRLVDDTRFVNPAREQAGLWRLDFVRKGTAGTNEHVFVDNLATSVSRSAERTPTGMRFTWRGIDIAGEKGVLDVYAAVDLPSGNAASEWRIAVSNRSAKVTLYETSYPLLRKVTPEGKGDWLLPYGALGAVLKRGYAGAPTETKSWSPGWRPPVAAFNIGEAGIYFAAELSNPN